MASILYQLVFRHPPAPCGLCGRLQVADVRLAVERGGGKRERDPAVPDDAPDEEVQRGVDAQADLVANLLEAGLDGGGSPHCDLNGIHDAPILFVFNSDVVSYCCHFVKGTEESRGDRPRNPQGNFTAEVGNIPEPTRATLLLLGMAGLALKRKLA